MSRSQFSKIESAYMEPDNPEEEFKLAPKPRHLVEEVKKLRAQKGCIEEPAPFQNKTPAAAGTAYVNRSSVFAKSAVKDPLDGIQYYKPNMNEKRAHEILRQINEDGAFLVLNNNNQYSILIHYNRSIYNLQVRKTVNDLFGLGDSNKDCETLFDSILDLIESYQNHWLCISNSIVVKLKFSSKLINYST